MPCSKWCECGFWMLRGWALGTCNAQKIYKDWDLRFTRGNLELLCRAESLYVPLHLSGGWQAKKDRQTLQLQGEQPVLSLSSTAKETAKLFPLSPGSVVLEFFVADAVLCGSVCCGCRAYDFCRTLTRWHFHTSDLVAFHCLVCKRLLGSFLSSLWKVSANSSHKHSGALGILTGFQILFWIEVLLSGGQSFLITWKYTTKCNIWLMVCFSKMLVFSCIHWILS